MYERKSPEAPLRGSKTTNTSQLPPPHRVQTTRANAQQRRRVASRRIASPKRHRASSHRGTHLRRESPAIANNIQANLKMSEDEDEFEAEERRKDEAGAKAAQELADKQKRHLNKKVREDPEYPTKCVCRLTVGEVPSSQLDGIIPVPDHPELKICDDVTGYELEKFIERIRCYDNSSSMHSIGFVGPFNAHRHINPTLHDWVF